jgi:TPP-dependent pyruvate/acetoin dehydrogenase alpha subunit
MIGHYQEFQAKLFNPERYFENIDVSYIDGKEKVKQLESMLIIRYAEEKLAEKIIAGNIKCPCHLGIGQEAIAVGVSAHLRKTDKVFGAHRSHPHFLALNHDVFGLFAETLGRIDGCSNGLGGSMHLIDRKNGFWGSVPIVGATIPIAAGAGLSIKLDGTDDVAVSYLGDGATEEGVFHETMNFSKVNSLPVLFVCENNLFASHMHILERQPELSTLRYAKAHNVPGLIVDGNDISAVYKAAQIAIEHIRSGNGPFFLECISYRWKGHVGPSDDNDVGLQRGDVLQIWKQRDPVRRLLDSIIESKEITLGQFEEIKDKIRTDIDLEWERALLSEYPGEEYLYNTVFSNS